MKRTALILAALMCMASRHPDRMIRSDLALNASFNRGDATARDINGVNGTLSNGAAVTAGNRYVTLDGTNDVVAWPDSAALTMSGTMSVSLWFQPSTPGSVIRELFGKYNGTGNQRSYTGYIDYSTTPNAYVFAWSSNGANACVYRFNTSAPAGWNHVVFVLNVTASAGARVACYINGTALSVSSVVADSTAAPYDSTAELLIGAQGTSAAPVLPWKGDIDDFRLYTRALSAAEVAAIYSSGRE